jgi:hypothetical protein
MVQVSGWDRGLGGLDSVQVQAVAIGPAAQAVPGLPGQLGGRDGQYRAVGQRPGRIGQKFGLPAAKLKVTTTLAGASAPYVAGTEEVEDTEIVHAIAPGATLDVVLVPANATASAANLPRP